MDGSLWPQLGPPRASRLRLGLTQTLFVFLSLCSWGCAPSYPPAGASAPQSGDEAGEQENEAIAERVVMPEDGEEGGPSSKKEDEPKVPVAAESVDDPSSERTTAPLAEMSAPRTNWLEDGRAPQPTMALPKVETRHIGMHLGGESNSDEAKRPWLKAIERQTNAFLRCYRLTTFPLKGGTFGVDLYLAAPGGAPTVKRTRQKIGGPDFDACMRRAFADVRFDKPRRPTVLSYSLRFDISGVR